MGSQIHEVIATMMRVAGGQAPGDSISISIDHTLDQYPDAENEEPIKIGWTEYNRAEIREMLVNVFNRFRATRYAALLDKYEIVDVEKDFVFEFSGAKFAGTIDLVLRNRETGKIEILDWKSISRTLPENYLELDTQKYMYAVGCMSLYGEYPAAFHVCGILKRKVKYPSVLKSGKVSTVKDDALTINSFMAILNLNNQNPDEYAEIIEWIKEKEATDIDIMFPMQTLALSEDAIRAGWRRVTELKLMFEFSRNNDIWPKCDGAACAMCKNSYLKLCVAEEKGEDTTTLLMDEYIVRDPEDRAAGWDL